MNYFEPKVSVIMSVYNNQDYLKYTIESVLNQTYKNFEFIITDDASNDKSAEIIMQYASIDSRIRVIKNKKNIGLTKSLNNMLEISEGKLVARIDGDDICLPDRLEKQVNIFRNNVDIGIVFSDTILIDYQGNIICESWRPREFKTIQKLMFVHNYIPHPTVMYNREIIIRNGKYNEAFRTGQDRELWLRLIENGVKFEYIRESLVMYRLNPNSVRVEKQKNNNYKIASAYISNRQKREALKYINDLVLTEKIYIFIKLILPYQFIYLGDVYKRTSNYFKRKYSTK